MVEQRLLRSHGRFGIQLFGTWWFFYARLVYSMGFDHSRWLASGLSPIFHRIGSLLSMQNPSLRRSDLHFSNGGNLISAPLSTYERSLAGVVLEDVFAPRVMVTACLFIQWTPDIRIRYIIGRRPFFNLLRADGTICVRKCALSEIETPNVRSLRRNRGLKLSDVVEMLNNLDRLVIRLLYRR